MAVDFRLAYNNGASYTDLFPKTSLEALTDAGNILAFSTITVTIPPAAKNTLTQIITISTTPAQVNAPVLMFLNSSGKQASKDYNTITQFEVMENKLSITRLYTYPEESIDVTLVFEEGGAQ